MATDVSDSQPAVVVRRWQELRRVRLVLFQNWWMLIVGAVVVGLLALLASLVQTEVYRSTASLYVTSGSDGNAQSAYQGSLASQQRVSSYAKLVSSDAVIGSAIRSQGLSMSIDDVKAKVSASTSPDTVILDVAAEDADPQTASDLANAVASSMVSYVNVLERPSSGGEPLAKVTVVTPATESSSPVSPKVFRNTLLGLLLGAILGGLVVLVRFRFDNRLRGSDELEEVSQVATLATIPNLSFNTSAASLLDFSGGGGAAPEAYRKLRTNLAFSSIDLPVKRILVTSPTQSDGKTTTAINLAAAIAESGARVILVDADLRRPSVASSIGVNGNVGLTDLLGGTALLSDVVQRTTVANLDVLAAGSLPPNPAELLGTRASQALLSSLPDLYDFVIVDSPPILVVADSSVLCQWVDGVVLVARCGRTRISDLQHAVGQLGTANARILGTVLNDVPLTSAYYGYGGTYSYEQSRSVAAET